MFKISLYIILLFPMITSAQRHTKLVNGKQLAPIPDSIGFAGSFAGVSGGVLMVAGGANFPGNRMPWAGGQKKWYDDIYALRTASGAWERIGHLPRPLGYGVSVTTKNYWIIIGGSNAGGHYSDVYALSYRNDQLKITTWPSLPVTLANSCGAIVGNKIYVQGGLLTPDDPQTCNVSFSLDLRQPEKGWTPLPPLPGPSRMLAVAASMNGSFYVCSGTQLTAGKRTYLRDAYAFHEKTGWTRLADMPQATVAAPGPAFCQGSRMYIFGGDDGRLADKDLRENHPGFSTEILEWDAKTGKWQLAGHIPVKIRADAVRAPNQSFWAPVTTSLVVWGDRLVIPGGEVRPGTRTPHVWSLALPER